MTRQIRCVFYRFILLHAIGCSGDFSKPNRVVLVFRNCDEEAQFTNRVKYVDDYLIPHVFVPGEFGQDKWTIYTSREYIDIAYQFNEPMVRPFVFRNGDSLLVDLEEICRDGVKSPG